MLLRNLFISKVLLAIIFIGGCAPTNAPQSPEAAVQADAVKKMVEEKTFVIKVNRATTNKGRAVNLTTTYSVSLSPDKFICDLPFYGEAYGGSGYGGTGPVSFTSTNFTVTTEAAKKGGWDIMVKPNDQQDVRSAAIYISESGYANLNFTFQNRTPMQYYGSVVTK